jgi:hypothetical protein
MAVLSTPIPYERMVGVDFNSNVLVGWSFGEVIMQW